MTSPPLRVPEAYRDLARAAVEQGWVITRRKSGHLMWRPPEGAAVFSPATPSDGPRSRLHVRAKLRRAGLAA